MRVRQRRLDRAFAGAFAKQSPFAEGAERPIGLKTVAEGGIEKTIDAPAHVAEGKIGGNERAGQRRHEHREPF